MRFQLLGPVMGYSGEQRIDLGSAKQRCVLAVLLLDAGRVVPIEQLIHRVWGEEPPRTVRSTLYSYVARIRTALRDPGGQAAGMTVVRHAGGYVLEADHECIDVHSFRRLTETARAADDDGEAGDLLHAALDLWQDEALSGLTGAWAESIRTRLDAERVAAALQYNDIRIGLGEGEELLPELRSLMALRPLDERLAGQLVTALYQAGRQVEALETYEVVRDRLVGELGIDPNPDLQALHRQVLSAAPALKGTSSREPEVLTTVPRQLPALPTPFVGRERELSVLDEMIGEGPESENAAVVAVIGGMGGVGKTWLAIRWAYRHLSRFPDGQLYVDLRGFDHTEDPISPAAVLRGLLDALGVPPAVIPAGVHAQTGLYRSLIAGKRMLIVLDNARDTAQVAPLLPGGPHCTTLITSRNALAGLHTTSRTRALTLGAFADEDARRLLAERLGFVRLDDETDAVAALLSHSAGLPLALGILATRAAAHPEFPLAVVAKELHSEATRLDVLGTGELSTDLRAVFASSRSALDQEAARMFDLLGLAPGSDISLDAAASLADLPSPRTRVLLRRLGAAHLVQQQAPGRYAMHDLIRLFAVERGRMTLGAVARDRALRRLADFCLHTAYRADRLLSPHRETMGLPIPRADRPSDVVHDAASALAWFEAEHGLIADVQSLAAKRGWYALVWQLAWVSEPFRLRRGRYRDNLMAWRLALKAAEHLRDSGVSAPTLRFAGRAFAMAREYPGAEAHSS
ncbi:BTAD domain-containing putative transcriptional regulator [Streptomyces sp. NPDC002476]|uniref:AfsR/SARP family transcriptional regulator n=1 Tax=Streptomyces sp. NPDC002476 TaxID=3364648 RepID=UPI0036737E3C